MFCLSILCLSCSPTDQAFNGIKKPPIIVASKKDTIRQRDTCALERFFVQKKLVNIHSLDSSIRVVLHYSTAHNFLNKSLYGGLTDCYLPCEVAIKLCNAQQFLHEQTPNYHLVVFDATRPLHIQKKMWDELKLPASEKINYLAHPSDISLHNYGAAVDIGIIGENGLLLDMGTPFDFFGELSEPRREKEFIKTGKLSQEALTNRLLLRHIMMKANFTPITSEWWHFNATNKVTAASRYDLIN
jgi:D-alanyl-D-alanine dipeptidase